MLTKCVVCGVQFQSKTSKAKYCSRSCKQRHYAQCSKIQVQCQYCGKTFTTRNRKKRARFCSTACGLRATTSEIHKTLVCQECGKTFQFVGRTSKKRCQECSKKNAVKATMLSRKKRIPTTQIGVGSGRAQYTNTPRDEGKLYKRRLKYRLQASRHVGTKHYRQKVITGNDSCCICGYSDQQDALVVHHIDMDRTNNNIQNLAVICANCHACIHSYIKRNHIKDKLEIVNVFTQRKAKIKGRN